MSDDRHVLLSKIRKCLALAKSSNEHEAAAALAKARALMDEHDLSMDDIALSEIGEAKAKGTATQRPPLWETALCMTVRHALGCKVIIDADLHRIYIGPGPVPEIAGFAFTVLFRQLKAARQEYIRVHLKRCRPGRKRQRADVFCEAWARAVYSKVKALMPPVAANLLVDQYIAKRFGGDLATVDNRSASTKGGRLENDYWRGHQAGRKVDLSKGVGGSAERLQLA
ncbi:Protein of unknown function [Sphingobium faniae]|nr:Protein of unknown function [Sphingobium faniae]